MASPATCSQTGHGGSMPKPVLVGEPGATGSHVLSGKDLRIGIVSTRWYDDEIVGPLTEACSKELQDKGVAASDIIVVQVSGAFELPFAAMRLIDAEGDRLDAVVCIGCMVKGRTMAYEFVSEAVTMGIMKLNVKTDTPVIFGVLTVANEEDAKACAAARGSCGGSSTKCSHGVEWAQSALEMARLKHATAPKIAGKCKCQCHCETKDCNCACHCSKCGCNACSCSDCKCTSCKGSRGVGKSGAKSSSAKICSQCGDETDKCRCDKCMCKECCNKLTSQIAHAEDKKCSQCGDEVGSCRCKDCKCTGCCAKGTAASETKEEDDSHICSTCGIAADQCRCTDCQCSGCRSDKGAKRTAEKQCGDCCKA